MLKGVAAWLALCALGMACCMLTIGWGSSAHPGLLLSSQSLSYSNRGMTWKEKDAVRKSKDLARKAAGKVDNTPSLVDRFMGAWKNSLGRAENEWDNGIAPTLKNRILPQFGLSSKGGTGLRAVKTRGMQQLAVVMTECVKCVEGCDAYQAEPFQAKDFGEFETMAKAKCKSCFNGVKGPCPANKDNHGVV